MAIVGRALRVGGPQGKLAPETPYQLAQRVTLAVAREQVRLEVAAERTAGLGPAITVDNFDAILAAGEARIAARAQALVGQWLVCSTTGHVPAQVVGTEREAQQVTRLENARVRLAQAFFYVRGVR
jgi:hypothetical protein